MTSVAPNCLASSSLPSLMSIPMMRSAPAITAPCTTFSPMPPQPITATVAPAGTLARRITAPTPVGTPQPTSAARSHGISSSIFTRVFSCTSICSANVASPASCSRLLPSRLSRNRAASPGPPRFMPTCGQMLIRPERHHSHWPQKPLG
jgi:hypothetical protein